MKIGRINLQWRAMYKIVIRYGVLLALALLLLELMEYYFVVKIIPLPFYVLIIALLFTGLGIWLGKKLTTPAATTGKVQGSFVRNEKAMDSLGISDRELEVLEQLAKGQSNQEIADELFISVNTVKTHLSSLYQKLQVSRRSLAVKKARSLKLIP